MLASPLPDRGNLFASQGKTLKCMTSLLPVKMLCGTARAPIALVDDHVGSQRLRKREGISPSRNHRLALNRNLMFISS